MKKHFLPIMSALLLTACSTADKTGQQPVDESFTLSSFEQFTVPDNAGQVCQIDSLMLGAPYGMTMLPDGFLAFKDSKATKQVGIIDLKNNSVVNMIPRGEGPLEIISVRDITAKDGNIWISGLSDRKVLRLSPVDGSREFEPQMVCRLADTYMRVVPYGNDRLLAMPMKSSDARMVVMNLDGTPVDTIAEFPKINVPEGCLLDNGMLQSLVTVSPDSRNTAVICQSWNCIDIFNENLQLTRRLTGPVNIEAEIKPVDTPFGTQYAQAPMWQMFDNAISNNKEFMVGYIGVNMTENNGPKTGFETVLSFTWDGKPLKSYRFESTVTTFAMDWEKNVMYCVTDRNDEPVIVKYDLNNLKKAETVSE